MSNLNVLQANTIQKDRSSYLYGYVWSMWEASRLLGEIVELRPFRLPETFLDEIGKLVRQGPRLYINGNDDNRASFRYVRAGNRTPMEYRDEFPRFPVFDTVRQALIPGTGQGGIYLDIPLFPGDELYGHLIVSYRSIPDEVVAWVMKGLFGIDVVVVKRSE